MSNSQVQDPGEFDRDPDSSDHDDTPETPPTEPPPVPVKDPPKEPGQTEPYIVE